MAKVGKVIKGLECCLNGPMKCEECPYMAEDGATVPNCVKTLRTDVLSLLKAQEPKPPRFVVTFDKIFYACDNCGKSLLVVANAEGIKGLGNMPKYCPECGQAVKWDE